MDIRSIILTNTYTLSQLKHRVALLKSFLKKHIFGAPIAPTDDWIKTLPQNLFSQVNKDNLTLLFENLQFEVSKLEVLTLYLTFDPDELTLTQLGEMVRKTFGRIILVDVKYDPNLIAGCSLVWKGLMRDYSLRSNIEARKGIILESFKKYLR